MDTNSKLSSEMMKGGGQGREGDWECSGCANRNYAFRSYCNRCKQPRILVDHKTPPDSKWLPRIGDWICSGCTNNNYASREKCKKCGQPKEVAAVPALAISAASLPTHPHYFARVPGLHQLHQQKINLGYFGNGAPQQSLPLSGWPLNGVTNYGVQTAVQPVPPWPLSGIPNNGNAYANQANQFVVQKGWRNGDWICKCGFHNYSSRLQCKKCDASMTPAIGTKRLASEEIVQDSENKRLNAGHTFGLPQEYPSFEENTSSGIHQTTGVYPPYPGGSSSATPNLQVNVQLPQLVTPPALLGKGARQWREGDWMCTNCNNHNYASRAECNRCKTQREAPPQPVNVDVSVA